MSFGTAHKCHSIIRNNWPCPECAWYCELWQQRYHLWHRWSLQGLIELQLKQCPCIWSVAVIVVLMYIRTRAIIMSGGSSIKILNSTEKKTKIWKIHVHSSSRTGNSAILRSVAPNGSKVIVSSGLDDLTGDWGGGAAALCSTPHESSTRPCNANQDKMKQ